MNSGQSWGWSPILPVPLSRATLYCPLLPPHPRADTCGQTLMFLLGAGGVVVTGVEWEAACPLGWSDGRGVGAEQGCLGKYCDLSAGGQFLHKIPASPLPPQERLSCAWMFQPETPHLCHPGTARTCWELGGSESRRETSQCLGCPEKLRDSPGLLGPPVLLDSQALSLFS